MADIQISATGGDVTEQTYIQIRRGSTVTDSPPVEDDVEQFSAHEGEELNEDPLHYEDPVMHISGAGHWFLEGWIGDHAVDFLVDSGSSVRAMSDIFYKNLVHAGAPVGALQTTARTLRSANGTGIEVLGCSRCSVSFLGLRTEFPIVVCSLAAGTDAIIGTDVLGSVLPHTLDIKKGLLFAQGGASLQLHRRNSALSGHVFTVGHSSIPPYSEAVLHCSIRTTGGRALPSSGLLEGLTLFAEETGLIVGRTLVDPSGWKVPVLVSNFSQETVVVSPFTEVGMIAQVTAIQSVTDDRIQRRGVAGELPHHLRDLVDQTSGDLDGDQRRRLAEVLLEYADIFPVPGDPLTGHTDAVEHDINTGDRSPIRCAPRRMSSQKMKREEDCVADMLTGGQIEASDSPWSSPVVLVTKKDGGTRFCVDYRQLNDATIKDAYPLPRIDDTLDMLAGKQWFSTLDLASGYWQVSLSKEARAKTPANRPLQLLEAGRLGASAPQHVPSRPAVPDLCIASSSLLSALDPLPLDRISRHTVEEISLWPAADRHAILAVANRDVRVARQNIAELMLYVDDHAAHLANCASAGDDSLTLMSAELIPRLEGGIRAVLDEADNM